MAGMWTAVAIASVKEEIGVEMILYDGRDSSQECERM